LRLPSRGTEFAFIAVYSSAVVDLAKNLARGRISKKLLQRPLKFDLSPHNEYTVMNANSVPQERSFKCLNGETTTFEGFSDLFLILGAMTT
jgi:hypothetical protein